VFEGQEIYEIYFLMLYVCDIHGFSFIVFAGIKQRKKLCQTPSLENEELAIPVSAKPDNYSSFRTDTAHTIMPAN
jgi:hypothetical protein